MYNGDDNHKVWPARGEPGYIPPPAPSTQDQNDGIYGDYGSTMRSFRSNVSGISSRQRPRQMMMQSPPPPPIPEEFTKDEKEKKEKKKRRKSKSRDTPDEGGLMMNGGIVPNGNGTSTAGSVINAPSGRASSMMGGRKMSAGSFMGLSPNGRPPMNGMPPHGPPGPPPGPYGPPPPQMILPGPGPKSKRSSGTFSSGRKGAVPRGLPPYMMYGPGLPPPGYMVPPGPPPHMMPPLGHRLYGPPPPHFPGGGPYPMGGRAESHMEEPIYMPQDARPLSPVASYQPGHFPHHMYYSQQQYATVDRAR